MLPTRKSVPRSRRKLDPTKASWPLWRDANWSGMGMPPVHQVWLKPSCTVQQGGRRQGRQKKRWEDDIREWTGVEFTKSLRSVQNREKWRKLIMMWSHLWSPQQPSRLRDRWRWRKVKKTHMTSGTISNWLLHRLAFFLGGWGMECGSVRLKTLYPKVSLINEHRKQLHCFYS